MKNKLFLITLLFIATFGYSQFNEYVPQNPVRAMRDVGIYKQRLYNERLNWIQQEIYRLNDLNYSLFDKNKLPSDFNTVYHGHYLNGLLTKYIDAIKAYDYADNYVFDSIQLNLKKIEKYYYEYYNNEVEVYNSKKK